MSSNRLERIASNTPWEPIFGYCRAVRAGEWLLVSGTTATDERGLIVGANQMYVQARQALQNLRAHIERCGLGIDRVARTRVFVTDISRFAEVARAHQEVFGSTPPASTCVEVRRLVHPDMLVEIEADVFAGPSADEETAGAGRVAAVKKVRERPAATKKSSTKRISAARSKSPRKR